MRLRAIVFALVGFGAAGALGLEMAQVATAYVEHSSAAQITETLAAADQTWTTLEVDGLVVRIGGEAPDESSRFRVLEIVSRIVDYRRVADAIIMRPADPTAPPAFALELLRNGTEVSLIGLVPESAGRAEIVAALRASGLAGAVTDMLDSAAHHPPEGWDASLGFALAVLAQVPQAKISVAPGRVSVTALAESEAARGAMEAMLYAALPDDVVLDFEVSAPRQVIAPFVFDVTLVNAKVQIAACSAESPEGAAVIGAAARRLGFVGSLDCAVGFGAPSPEWSQAVARGISALGEIGGGRFVLRDIEAELTGLAGLNPERFAEVAARLEADFPAVFSLRTELPVRAEVARDDTGTAVPRFDAMLGADGAVRLSGPVHDATAGSALESFAMAHFGYDRVMNATVLDTSLPEGWSGRVLAGIEALSQLKEGRLAVTAEDVTLEGWGLDAQVDLQVAALLAEKVGDDAVIDVRFDAAAANAAAMASRSLSEICVEEVDAILASGSIEFSAGSAEIDSKSRGVIAAIADVLRGCPGADFEVGGHTDSQGAEDANLRLSDERAAAVVDALRAAELPLIGLTARGYGLSRPVADNSTADGRARNRRIAFTLMLPETAAEVVTEQRFEPQ